MIDTGPLGDCIVSVAYPSYYVQDLSAATAFYAQVLGPAEVLEDAGCVAFRLGDTRMTLFPAKHGPHPDGGPRNTEIAIRVRRPGDVDLLHARLVELGATPFAGMEPHDTRMYEHMRFACVDDPFGLRIDVYCPIPESTDGPAPQVS